MVGGTGEAAFAAGVVLIVKDSPAEVAGRQHQRYWPTLEAGLGVTTVGVAAVAVGVYFAFLRPAPTGEVDVDAGIAGPTVQVGQGGVQLGWQGRF